MRLSADFWQRLGPCMRHSADGSGFGCDDEFGFGGSRREVTLAKSSSVKLSALNFLSGIVADIDSSDGPID
jgi:hypothetical protein